MFCNFLSLKIKIVEVQNTCIWMHNICEYITIYNEEDMNRTSNPVILPTSTLCIN